MKRRIVSGFLVFLLSFGFLILYSPSVKAIKDFSVEVTPRRIGVIAKYKFRLSLEKKLEYHQWIHVNFPKGTLLTPPIPKDEHERKLRLKEIIESIEFGVPCTACQGLPIIENESDGSLTMKFHLPIEVDPTKEGFKSSIIIISEKAGFTNPTLPGSYTYRVKTQQESTYTESLPVEIAESKISTPKITMQNPIFNQISGYDIEFQTGRTGQLDFQSNSITLQFPPGTMIPIPPKDILCQLITVNGYPVLTQPIIEGEKITLNISFKITDDARVKIHIDPKWGIKNPRNPGMYKIMAFTSTDIDPVESEVFEIKKGPDQVFLDVIPSRVDRIAEFTLTFVVGDQTLANGEIIQVLFPDLFTLPSSINPRVVTIQGKVVDLVEITGHIVSVRLNQSIQKGEGVELVFSKDAGIRTPKIPCEIGIRVTLKDAKIDLYSNLAEIIQQPLEVQKILVNPPNEGEKANYQFSLLFGDKLAPEAGDEIQIQFNFLEKPITYTVESSIPKESQEFLLTLQGIINPPTGRYSVRITTEKEKVTSVESIWIIPARPVTKINVTGGKMGKNGWYIDSPFIDFKSTDPDSFVNYYYDDPKFGIRKFEGHSYPLTPGQYITKIYYFAVNGFGQEDPKMVEIKVDYVNPEIGSITPDYKKKIETNKKEFTIKGKVSQIKTILYGEGKVEYCDRDLTIQGIPVNVSKENGTFSYDATLQEGINEIIVHLEDDAGRITEKVYQITLDTTPPILEIPYPIQNSTILNRKFIFTGNTEPNTHLLINGEFVYVEADGSFQKEVTLFRPGLQQIEIKASDKLDNEVTRIIQFFYGYTIQLWIGKAKVRNNAVEKEIPLAPFIKEGKTMVPFRLIGEELKAKILYSTDNKTKQVTKVSYELDGSLILITIGDRRATVNGKEVLMDVPAYIVSGFTVVPLRFVTIGLGCKVEWEPISQMITIQYPGI